jgi:hypothetical protein|tara:strand:+ start:905 stop:1564 length:660 start_codon:yes stop_codon:yes gene_type:complete
MNVLKRATDILGAAPLFIVFSAVFVISELTVMWILIPSTASSKNTQQDLLIDSFLNEDGSFAASDEVSSIIFESNLASNKLDNDPSHWQETLVVKNPCHRELVQAEETSVVEKPSESWMAQQMIIEIADRAMFELELTSIMKGSKSLANISGRIYQIGDAISPSNASGSFVVIDIGMNSVLLSLVTTGDVVNKDFGPIERTIYIEGSDAQRFVDAGENK